MAETLQKVERYPGFPNLNHLEPQDFPQHIAIIMDGNRHWGEEHVGDKFAGHPEGAQAALRLMRAALPLPGRVLTFWGFASDNWRRGETEVTQLMDIITTTIDDNSTELIEKGIRFVHIGRKDRIPKDLAESMSGLEEMTAENEGKIICAAIDFGGTDQEIRLNAQTARTAAQIARVFPHMSEEEIAASVDENWIMQNRDSSGVIPPANLIIRPQHYRTSDIGWINGPSTEVLFLPELQFPDMTPAHLEQGILQFARDKQNFGA